MLAPLVPVLEAEAEGVEEVVCVPVVAASAVTPELFEQACVLTLASVKVMSAHFSHQSCPYSTVLGRDKYVVESAAVMALLDDLDGRVLTVGDGEVAGQLERVPAEGAQSDLVEGVDDDDAEVLLLGIVAEREVHGSVGLVVAGLEAELAAGDGPAGARRRRRVETAAGGVGLRLAVVAAVGGVVQGEVGAGEREQGGEQGGTHSGRLAVALLFLFLGGGVCSRRREEEMCAGGECGGEETRSRYKRILFTCSVLFPEKT